MTFERTLSFFGRRILEFVEDVGNTFILFGRTVTNAPTFFTHFRLSLYQMQTIGNGSIPLVLVTATFVGAVTAVQAAYQFQDYVPMRFLGTVVGKSVILEVGPVLTALVVGGRVAASMAAEIGTMRVTEQIDALEMEAIDPVAYLVVPRFFAAILMLPVLTIFCDFLAIIGGLVVSKVSIGLPVATYVEGLRLFFNLEDVIGGLIKPLFFGGIISLMGCSYGFRTTGGAEGVGQSTMQAVVSSCVLILITNYFLASVLFRIIFAPSV
jgi:phospholipid/cholesterol/gamma-HCH transport system permease protein